MLNSFFTPGPLELSKRWTLRDPTWDVPVNSVEIWREKKIVQIIMSTPPDEHFIIIIEAILCRYGMEFILLINLIIIIEYY